MVQRARISCVSPLCSWCVGTVRNYISAEVGVPGKSGEGPLAL